MSVEFSLYVVAWLLYCVRIISVMRAPFQKHDVIVWVGLQQFETSKWRLEQTRRLKEAVPRNDPSFTAAPILIDYIG